MTEKEKGLRVFDKYTALYDIDNVMIRLKVDHTFRVADFAERIAQSLKMDEGDVLFAWLTGLLHDIGRFEQYKRYETFVDRESVDHAELGADILFKDGLIDEFSLDILKDDDRRQLLEHAIRQHNKLVLPEGMDARNRRFCEILRDADKVDIFRVLTEPPYDKRNSGIKYQTDDAGAREEIMECVRNHTCVPRVGSRTDFEALISQCCMAFELVYPESRKLVKEQGYLGILLNTKVANPKMEQQIRFLQKELAYKEILKNVE